MGSTPVMENGLISEFEELVRENAQKFSEMMSELNEAHKKEVQDLCQKYEDQIQLLRDQMNQRELENQMKFDHLQRMHVTQLERMEIVGNDSVSAVDSSKKLEEISKKFVGEKATLTVKLEATKKECEQRAKQSLMLEQQLSQEKRQKVELLKTVEQQSKQISKLIEDLNLRDANEEEKAKVLKEQEVETSQGNISRKLEAGEGQLEIWKEKADTFMKEIDELRKLKEHLEKEMESMLKSNKEELILARKEAEEWKMRSGELEQQYLAEMENWRKSFEQKSQELESLRESFEASQEELEVSRFEVQRLKESSSGDSGSKGDDEKDAVQDYQHYLEDVEEKDAEILVLQDKLTEKDVEIQRLKQSLQALSAKGSNADCMPTGVRNRENLMSFNGEERQRGSVAMVDNKVLHGADGDREPLQGEIVNDHKSDDDQILSESNHRNLLTRDGDDDDDLHLSFETDNDIDYGDDYGGDDDVDDDDDRNMKEVKNGQTDYGCRKRTPLQGEFRQSDELEKASDSFAEVGDMRSSEDNMIRTVAMEILRFIRPKALFERKEDETELEAMRREITSLLRECETIRSAKSVEEIFKTPSESQEQVKAQLLTEASPVGDGDVVEEKHSEIEDSEKLEMRHRLQQLEKELNDLKEDFEKSLGERITEFQSQFQLQKEMELESLKHQLEEIDSQKQSEMRQVFEDGLQRLKDQSQQELNAKNEQIKQMGTDIFRKAEDIRQLHSKLAESDSSAAPHPASQDLSNGGLVSDLQADLDRLQAERNTILQTNNQLMMILSEMVRTSLDMERRIAHSLMSLDAQQQQPNPIPGNGNGACGGVPPGSDAPLPNPREVLRRLGPGGPDEETNLHDMSIVSDEGLDVSQRFVENLFVGSDLDADSEEIITDSSNRIQRAVDRLLDEIEESGRQLREARRVESELLNTVQQRLSEVEELRAKCNELDELLKQEKETREFLSLELYKAEGLVQGYAAEKQSADACIQSLEETNEMLAKDLEKTRLKLKEMVEKETELSLREQDLAHQRHSLELSVGDQERGLVQENTQLTEEARQLKRKLEDEKQRFENRLREAEGVNDELHRNIERLNDEWNAVEEDYKHKIEALEKQMKYDRHFHEEQTVERELERDDYQRQIDKLELQKKEWERRGSSQNRLTYEMQELEDQLKEKSESNNELAKKVEDLERENASQQITASDLREFSRSLESELNERCKQEHVLQETINALEQELKRLHEVPVASPEDKQKDDSDLRNMRRTIHDLEAEVEKLVHSEQSFRIRNKQLEDEIRNLKTLKEELMQERESLQNQVCSQLSQISSLRTEMDSLKIGIDQQVNSEIAALRNTLQVEHDLSSRREQEVSELSEQLDEFREKIVDMREELEQVKAELDVVHKEKENLSTELDTRTLQHLEEKELIEMELKSLRTGASLIETMPLLSRKLLNEKNEEIDQLTKELVELHEYVSQLERGVLSSDIIHSRFNDRVGNRILNESTKRDTELSPELHREQDNTLDHDLTLHETTATPLMQSKDSDSLLLVNTTEQNSEISVQVQPVSKANGTDQTDEEVLSTQISTSKKSRNLNGIMEEISCPEEQLPSLPHLQDICGDDTDSSVVETSELGIFLTKSNGPNDLSLHHAKYLDEPNSTDTLQEELSQHDLELSALNDVLQEKENTIEVLTQQVQNMQNEVDSLKDYQSNLQLDFEQVHQMVEEKQKEIESLTQELYTLQSQVEAQSKFELEKIRKEMKERQNAIDEKEEEMYELMLQLEKKDEVERELSRMKQLVEQQDRDLKQKAEDISNLKEQLAAFQVERSDSFGVPQKIKDLEEELEKLTVQLTQSDAEKEKQTELVNSLTEALNKELTKADLKQELSEMKQIVEKQHHDIEQKNKEITALQEEMDCLLQQRTDDSVALERVKNDVYQEIVRTRELLEEKELDLRRKTEDLAMIQQQLKTLQQEKAEFAVHMQRVKDLEKSLESVTAKLRDSESERKRLELLRIGLAKALDEEQVKVPFEQSDEVRRVLQAVEERHAAELERHKMTLETELNKRLLEESSRLRDLHSQQVESLAARHEIELSLLKSQEAVIGDDEEYVGTLCEAVDTSVRIDSSFIDDSSEELPTNLEGILKKLHSESIKVLSLSDIQYLRGLEQHFLDLSKAEATWLEEKNSLLAAIQALKQLLSQTNQITDVGQMHGGSDVMAVDWRKDLLKAIYEVFAKEREALRSDLRTYRLLNPTENQNHLEELEKAISNQDVLHRDALERLIGADHQSLIREVDSLIQRNSVLKKELQQERDKVARNALIFEDQYSHKERELKHQVDAAEFRLKQEKVLNDDLQLRLASEQSRLIEMSAQLSKERSAVSSVQMEIGELQAQLTKVKGQLGREQLQVQTLSTALADEQGKVMHLNGKVMQVQIELQQNQQKLNSEKTTGAESSRRLSSILENLEAELKSEKECHNKTRVALSGRDVTIVALEAEIESLRKQIGSQESQLKLRLKELETAVSMEKAQHNELTELLENERRLSSELRQTLEQEHESQHTLVLRFQNTIADLQANLDVERSKVLELASRIERDRCQNLAADEEKSLLEEKLLSESSACNQLRQSVANLTAQKQELQMELQSANQRLSALQESLSKSRTALENVESQEFSAKSEERQRHLRVEQERQNDRRKLFELESMLQAARQSVTRLEQELNTSRRNEMNALEDARIARLRANSSPRVTFSSSSKDAPPTVTATEKFETPGQSLISEALAIYQKHLEMFCQRLHLLALRLQEEITDVSVGPSKSGSGVDVRSEEQSLKKLFMELTSLNSSLQLESLSLNGANIVLSSVPALNEKILRHNSELTSYISHLMSEKHELHNIINELQNAIATYREEDGLNEGESVGDQSPVEQATLLRDSNQMALESSKALEEVTRLKAELRRARIELEQERQRSLSPLAAVGDLHLSADREKIQRLYGKYLRADCARKSLIYQKKYLLLLLGGFQECEEATLAAIARMGAFMPASSQDISSHVRSRPLSRFRTAATVVVAISRLRFLVTKWQRTTCVGTPVVGRLPQFSPGSVHVPQAVNGFGSAPHRSHSVSNVYQSSANVPNGRATGSAFDLVSRPLHLRSVHGSSSVSSTPRPTVHSTPPTKERSRNYQTGHLPAALSGNGNILRSTSLSMSSPSPRQEADSTTSLNDYLQRLEQIQQNLTTANSSSLPSNITTRK